MSRAPGEYHGLTTQQAELLSFLRYRQSAGSTPSLDEMKTALGLASKSSIHRLLVALEERGYIHRDYHRARSLTCFDTKGGTPSIKAATLAELVAEIQARGLRISAA